MKVFVLNTKNLEVVDLPQKIEGIFLDKRFRQTEHSSYND